MKTQKLQTALLSGETFTEAEITKKFGLQSPRAAISAIRDRGYAIRATKMIAGNNFQITKYGVTRSQKVVDRLGKLVG